MTSQIFQTLQQVKAGREAMRQEAAKGWTWFVMRPDYTIHSRHRSEKGTRHNINDYMRSQGFTVRSYGVGA